MTTTIPTVPSVPATLARHGILTRSADGTAIPSRPALAARLRELDDVRGTSYPAHETTAGTLDRHGVTVPGTQGIRWGMVTDRLHELEARTCPSEGDRVVLRSRLAETSPCCGARLTRPMLLDREVPTTTGTWPCAACGRTYRLMSGTRDPRTGGRYLQAARVPYGAEGRRA